MIKYLLGLLLLVGCSSSPQVIKCNDGSTGYKCIKLTSKLSCIYGYYNSMIDSRKKIDKQSQLYVHSLCKKMADNFIKE